MWWEIGNIEREMKSQAEAQHNFRQHSNAAALKQEIQHLEKHYVKHLKSPESSGKTKTKPELLVSTCVSIMSQCIINNVENIRGSSLHRNNLFLRRTYPEEQKGSNCGALMWLQKT